MIKKGGDLSYPLQISFFNWWFILLPIHKDTVPLKVPKCISWDWECPEDSWSSQEAADSPPEKLKKIQLTLDINVQQLNQDSDWSWL